MNHPFPGLPFPGRKFRTSLIAAVLFWVSSAAHAAGWRALLDKDLTQWRTYLGYRHSVSYDGTKPVDSAGKPIEPIGYDSDPTHVFSTIERDGEVILRISGEVYGCLFTKENFRNYHLRLKTRWGKTKFDPRKNKLQDSGLLYHSQGPGGIDYWRAWMLSQELQIMQGHIGDYWNIGSSAVDIRAFIPEGTMNSVASRRAGFLPFGAATAEGPVSVDSFCLRERDAETPDGGWTTVELICFEGKSLHIVNGEVVMVLQNSRFVVDGVAKPLVEGFLQLQCEAAEVFYKEIEIQPIDALPAEYAALFDMKSGN